MERDAERLRDLARVMRARNGRLGIDWVSRRQKPRWRMLALDSTWYDRDRLRGLVTRRQVVPSTSRRLASGELTTVYDPNPWRLFPAPARRPRPGT